MNKKNIKIISCFVAFILCFPLHFIYDLIPNTFTAIFFPVNESIWEHMKLLFDSLLLAGIFEVGCYQYFHISYHNLGIITWLGAFLSISLYLIIYLPFYYKFGENMILNLTVLFITIALINLFEYYLITQINPWFINHFSPILVICTYLVFAYLTYYPIHTQLFFDTNEEKYGLSNYQIK